MSTNLEIKTALKKSIKKWNKIQYSIINSDKNPCALCQLNYGCNDCVLGKYKEEEGSCCNEWEQVYIAIDNMLKRLNYELKILG